MLPEEKREELEKFIRDLIGIVNGTADIQHLAVYDPEKSLEALGSPLQENEVDKFMTLLLNDDKVEELFAGSAASSSMHSRRPSDGNENLMNLSDLVFQMMLFNSPVDAFPVARKIRFANTLTELYGKLRELRNSRLPNINTTSTAKVIPFPRTRERVLRAPEPDSLEARIAQIQNYLHSLKRADPSIQNNVNDLLANAKDVMFRTLLISPLTKRRLDQTTVLVADDAPTFGEVFFDDESLPVQPIILLNTQFIHTLTPMELAFLLLHELGHVWQGDASFTTNLNHQKNDYELDFEIEERCDMVAALIAIRMARLKMIPREAPENMGRIFEKMEAFRPKLPQAPPFMRADSDFTDPHPPDDIRLKLLAWAAQVHPNDILDELAKPYSRVIQSALLIRANARRAVPSLRSSFSRATFPASESPTGSSRISRRSRQSA